MPDSDTSSQGSEYTNFRQLIRDRAHREQLKQILRFLMNMNPDSDESRNVPGNADTVGYGTLQPSASLNDVLSRSWLRIISLREIQQVEGSWLKLLAGLIFAASASAGFSGCLSSTFTKVATAVAFSASLTAISLRHDRGEAAPRYLVKLGVIAYSCTMFATLVDDLSTPIMWAIAVAFLIAIIAVLARNV